MSKTLKTSLKETPKHDDGKLRFELLPLAPVREVVKVLTFGMKKYPDGWKGGLRWSRYIGAILRHVWAWWGGEKFDTETGCHHLAHAICCLLFLMDFEIYRNEFDDRDIETDMPFYHGVDSFDDDEILSEKKN